MRGLSTYMRNLPCLFHIHSCSFQKILEESNNTSAKEIDSLLKDISNGENIAMMIGLCQLFELYSKCSLTAQHSRKFPTSILEELMSLINELQDLSQKWTLQKEQLNFSCFGKPFEFTSEMVLEGLYKPKTSKSSCTRAKVKQSIYEKRACEMTLG